ncbi:GNAT family N-acetyltransferase [Mesorhizobium japonicum]|uniref:GNAT family N-acetyltransferase n=1 Tax=Mesorhizobium japonicum TaxID=2066070 RepID=UPI00268FE8E6
MVHDRQRSSLRAGGQLALVTFRKPTWNDAADVWDLIALCPQLDRNSLYCESSYSALISPTHACSRILIWQIAVHPMVRSTGLGKELILSALNGPSCEGVTHIKATVTLSNRASKLFFAAVAKDLGAPIRQTLWFDRVAHFKGRHDSEYLITIGPIAPSMSKNSARST